jgi:outer membrane protein assembly factor BamB
MSSNIIFVGVKGHVVAINKEDGTTLWQTKLNGGLTSGDRFVSLLVEPDKVYAHTYGELYCLATATGAILWKNALEGLSFDIASLASEGISSPSLPALAVRKRSQSDNSGSTANAAGN